MFPSYLDCSFHKLFVNYWIHNFNIHGAIVELSCALLKYVSTTSLFPNSSCMHLVTSEAGWEKLRFLPIITKQFFLDTSFAMNLLAATLGINTWLLMLIWYFRIFSCCSGDVVIMYAWSSLMFLLTYVISYSNPLRKLSLTICTNVVPTSWSVRVSPLILIESSLRELGCCSPLLLWRL